MKFITDVLMQFSGTFQPSHIRNEIQKYSPKDKDWLISPREMHSDPLMI